MRLRRLRLAAVVAFIVLWMACGEYYRPVVIPLTTNPPTPSTFHTVFAITANTPLNPGYGMQINVSGDSDIGEATVGLMPTHATVAPNGTRFFVASAGSLSPNGTDSVALLSPASSFGGGLFLADTVSLPAGSLPAFLASTQNGFLYVANFGTNSVNAINTSTNQAGNPTPVGTNPVAMAETPDTTKLYVANQGSNSVTSLNTKDMSQNVLSGFSGTTPVWVVARADSRRIYALTQGDGQLVTIDTATDTVLNSFPVGAGANYMFYEPNLNRLYVTNPATATVYVFSATGGANDTPIQLTTLPIPGLSASTAQACPTCGPAVPVSVTALPDGSRFYVASYQIASTCPDPNVTVSPCVIPILTVFNAGSLALEYPKAPILELLTTPVFAITAAKQLQFAVPQVTSCVATPAYTPGSTRFRVFTSASADSTRVYVSMCDAGAVAVIDTTDSNTNNPGGASAPDSLVLDLPAPAAVCVGNSCGGQPPLQTPLLLVPGQ